YAFADALAGAGASLSIWGRSADRNAAAAAALGDHGTEVKAFDVDVTDEDAVVAAMAASAAHFGRIDACFANAAGLGVQSPSLAESTTDEWRATMATALDSVYFTMREATKILVAQDEGGSLVATSSIAANYGSMRGNHAYSSGKAAVMTLMRGL